MIVATSQRQARRTRHPIKTTVTADVLYDGTHGVDIYAPSYGPRPALILVHGGGWIFGDKATGTVGGALTDTAKMFAALGYAVFNGNYTIAPANYQTPITDVLNLTAWVRANAATYNADAKRVAVLGSSAGGHLALMAAIQGVAGGTRPDAVIGWSQPCDLGTIVGSNAPLTAQYMGDSYSGNEAQWNANSPRYAISGPICPIRVCGSASEDTNNSGVAQSQYDNFTTAAIAAGANITKRILTGTVHANFIGLGTNGGQVGVSDVHETHAWLLSVFGG